MRQVVLSRPSGRGEEGSDFFRELPEGGEVHLLLAVAHGLGGIWMDLDEEAVRLEGDGTTAKGEDEIRASAALAGIHDDREMGFLFGNRDGSQIESVAGVGLERADAALAEEDIWVAVGEDILGGQQPLLDFLAHPALEEHRFARSGALDEELEILRVAGADLEDVGRGGDMLDIALTEDFCDDFQSGFPAGAVQEAEAFLPEALKFIRRRAGLVGAAAKNGRPGRFDGAGRGEKLLLVFHRAGAGHQREVSSADFHAIHIHNGVLRMRLPACELVAFLDAQNALDLREGGEGLEILVGAFVADRRDHRLGRAEDRSGIIAQFGDLGDDLLNGGFGGVWTKNDDHGSPSEEHPRRLSKQFLAGEIPAGRRAGDSSRLSAGMKTFLILITSVAILMVVAAVFIFDVFSEIGRNRFQVVEKAPLASLNMSREQYIEYLLRTEKHDNPELWRRIAAVRNLKRWPER